MASYESVPMMELHESASVMGSSVGSDAGFNLGQGESLVPGSVQTVGPAAASTEAAAEPAAEPAASASDEGSADEPPAPTPDADTNI